MDGGGAGDAHPAHHRHPGESLRLLVREPLQRPGRRGRPGPLRQRGVHRGRIRGEPPDAFAGQVRVHTQRPVDGKDGRRVLGARTAADRGSESIVQAVPVRPRDTVRRGAGPGRGESPESGYGGVVARAAGDACVAGAGLLLAAPDQGVRRPGVVGEHAPVDDVARRRRHRGVLRLARRDADDGEPGGGGERGAARHRGRSEARADARTAPPRRRRGMHPGGRRRVPARRRAVVRPCDQLLAPLCQRHGTAGLLLPLAQPDVLHPGADRPGPRPSRGAGRQPGEHSVHADRGSAAAPRLPRTLRPPRHQGQHLDPGVAPHGTVGRRRPDEAGLSGPVAGRGPGGQSPRLRLRPGVGAHPGQRRRAEEARPSLRGLDPRAVRQRRSRGGGLGLPGEPSRRRPGDGAFG